MKPDIADDLSIQAADIDFSGRAPRSTLYDDVYHSSNGARERAQHVFIRGNGLPERWRNLRRFSVLEIGFGLGNSFLELSRTWQQDPQRPGQLHVLSVDRHPPTPDDLKRAHVGESDPVLEELLAHWPPFVPGLHHIRLCNGDIRLTLAWGDVAVVLKQLQGPFDAFFLDGFDPARNPQMWTRHLLAQLARLSAPQATAATWTCAREVQEHLRACGFAISTVPGDGPNNPMSKAVWSGSRVLTRPVGRLSGRDHGWHPSTTRVAVIGAGLAGAACARALADRGWSVDVFEAQIAAAQGASGNLAGLIHASVHGEDGPHARLHRAAALLSAQLGTQAIHRYGVPGDLSGLLSLSWDDAETRGHKAWPYPDTAREVDAEFCGRWMSTPTRRDGWLFPQGGWISPRHWVEHLLSHGLVGRRLNQPVSTLRRETTSNKTSEPGPRHWQLRGPAGEVLCDSDVVILALGDALPEWFAQQGWTSPALSRIRGQLSWIRPDSIDSCKVTHSVSIRPVTGHGYLAPHPAGGICFGATSQPDDDERALREGDHVFNLARLRELTGRYADVDASRLEGRVGFRLQTRDRLPLIGAWPDWDAWLQTDRRDQLRFMPRQAGLYVCGALGSRGLAWAPLAGEVLASHIDGTPPPLENDLLEAIDPGRFAVRQARMATSPIKRS